MIAFEIYINNDLKCVAGIQSKHILSILIHNKLSNYENSVSVNVSGSRLDNFNVESITNKIPLQQRIELVDDLLENSKLIMETWLNELIPLNKSLKIDIKIVDIDPKHISETKKIVLDSDIVKETFSKFFT